jgi:hypothetical protein
MTEQRPSKEQFQSAERLWLDGSTCEVAESYDQTMIYVGDLTLDMREAVALRGWLNKVIPAVPQVCQHDLLAPNPTVTVDPTDPFAAHCDACGYKWRTRAAQPPGDVHK